MNEQPLTIEQANRIADGLVRVVADEVDPALWLVAGDGLAETHEPMDEDAWRTLLKTLAAKLQPPTDVLRAFDRARADIASVADWIDCELQTFEDGTDEITWATVGTVAHVREKLIETLEFLSGVSQPEIQRSLDELHS